MKRSKQYPVYSSLAKGTGGGGADVSGVTATAGDVDTGKVFVNSSGAEVVGTSAAKTNYQNLNNSVKGLIDGTGKTFVIPDGVTTISDYSFAYKTSLTDVNIPSTVTTIGIAAFFGCTNLETSSLPNSITSIGVNAFMNCSKLPLTSLPSSLTTIGQGAFRGCTYLNLQSLPNGLQVIGKEAFYDAYPWGITEIPSSVVSIDQSAFRNSFGLGCNPTLTFLGTPTTINSNAFLGCSGIKTIRVPWSSGAISGAPWGATNATVTYDYTP